jgi:uncharacterized membrane protein
MKRSIRYGMFSLIVFVLALAMTPSVYAEIYTSTPQYVPDAAGAMAWGINGSGQIVGRYYDGTANHGFFWNGSIFTTIDYPGASDSFAMGINNSGQIAGYYIDTTGYHGFLWDNGVFTVIDHPSAVSETEAWGINDLGQVVGVYYDAAGVGHGYLWNGSSFTTMDYPGASVTLLAGISNSGQIVGQYHDGNKWHGFMISNGNYVTTDSCGSYLTFPSGINNIGQIVGLCIESSLGGTVYGYMLSGSNFIGGSFTRIDFPGYQGSTWALGINDAGQIAGGAGYYYNGGFAFIMTPLPVVYDNMIADTGTGQPIFQPGLNVEAGDEITLAGTERYVNNIDVLVFQAYSSGPGMQYTGTIDARVRFYQNDGQGGEPGTPLWDSGVVQDIPYGERFNTFSFNVPSILVPNTFIWTIELSNVNPANPADPYGFELPLYNPPIKGSSGDFVWQKYGLWTKVSPTPYTYDYNYAARVQASATSASLDTTPPTTTAAPAGGTYTTAQSVTLSCNDNGGSGCANSYYCLGASCSPATPYTGAIPISSSAVLRFYSIDASNNAEIVKTETYSVNVAVNYTITASAGTGGGITPTGATTVAGGGSQTYTIAPDPGYKINYVAVNGASVGAVPGYTFTNVQQNYTIRADFVPATYKITVTAGANGAISPGTYSGFQPGANQTYTIKPNTGYTVSDVLVDGSSVGAVTTYPFTNIQSDHTISAAFAQNPTYTITAMAGTGGSINPGTTTLLAGQSRKFTIAPASDYRIDKVLVDNVNKGAITSYTFSNVTADHTIVASFVPDIYTITATASGSGSISPAGMTQLFGGGSQTYAIAPAVGYKINYVAVNGASVGAVTSYTFSNVRQNYTIKADFVPVTYKITVIQGANGTVTPGTYSGFKPGSSQTYRIIPNAGYQVADVIVDNVSVGVMTSYTFTDIQANHRITATFAPNP